MARRRSFPTLALAALLGAAACGDIDAGRNNEDTGMRGGDLTPGDTRDGGTGTTYTVSADTSTPATAGAPMGDSARAAAATATGGDSVPAAAPAPGAAPGAGTPANAPGAARQPPSR